MYMLALFHLPMKTLLNTYKVHALVYVYGAGGTGRLIKGAPVLQEAFLRTNLASSILSVPGSCSSSSGSPG